MATKWINPVQTRADLLARAGWGVLAAIHVPILLKSSAHLLAQPGWEQGAKWAVLLLSLAWFAAKVGGLRVLDIRGRKTAAVMFLVACGLVHGPLRDKALSESAPETVAVLVAAGAVGAGLALRGRFSRAGGGPDLVTRSLLAVVWGRWIDERAACVRSLVGIAAAVPRGPPAI